ncbi:cytochrome P450 [Xylariales sp. AK1849]|nr:cytochrome P450 [Xylariales sp. AK1849]
MCIKCGMLRLWSGLTTVREEQKSLYLRLLRESRERMELGKGPACLLHQMLQDREKNDMDDEHIAYLAGNLMEAGSDTTASTLLSFLLAMIKYPEEFKRAQMEIDQVCGSLRSPTPDDIDHLPFIKACMDEGIFYLKAPLFSRIPGQSTTMRPNMIDPRSFLPDRFFNNEYGTRVPVDKDTDNHRRTSYAFGAGRRILNMAKIAWGFDLSPGPGPVNVDIATAYTDGFLIAPEKFPIVITPRSDRHKNIMAKEYETMKPFWKIYEE